MSAEKINILGVNHKTAPVEIRERLAFSDDPGTPYRELQVMPGCDEFCFLSTCNRVEVIFMKRLASMFTCTRVRLLYSICSGLVQALIP